jgi:hypothetical protein
MDVKKINLVINSDYFPNINNQFASVFCLRNKRNLCYLNTIQAYVGGIKQKKSICSSSLCRNWEKNRSSSLWLQGAYKFYAQKNFRPKP